MFAIYTPNGRTFTGTLEQLQKVDKSARAVAPKKRHDLDDGPAHRGQSYQPTPNAIEAYKEVIKQPEKLTAIKHAYQLMTAPVETLYEKDTFAYTIEKFKQFSYREFPVVNQQQQLVASLSRQDLYEYLLFNKPQLQADKTSSIAELFLTDKTITYSAEPVTDIRRIAWLFIDKQLHTIPIVEPNEKIVGVISRTDIIKATMNDPPLSLWC
ncbi:CBS domain-containing protein [Thalassotalea sp. G2M2-11]|uniref:CBS domain-containing protein n=1 Tax=Thalassotalea sp. G2M2-11 TaxID=2787627 RepID=UPI0019CFF0A4|nr:CBS domain-containing protein [Thalassotalea sp. G2M2-11]